MLTVKTLCLNMIVKNEMANLERCLGAVAPYVDCWVIGDTGSIDGTQDFIKSFFAARNIPGELHSFPFVNFEQARNAALDCAHASPLAYDYLLLDDADMELVVEDPDFRTKLEAPCYNLLQRSGISYWNARIVRRDAGARYHGVTHEYLGVPGGGNRQLRGVWYKDHASGSNRVDKFERDIRLLLGGLEQEPESHRYWFYLAQSYRDAGRKAEAADAYAKRSAMGGWDEEAWYARLQEARCLRDLEDDGGFVRQALAAFNQRPHRAEPLYDLARFYRERGMNDASVLFSEAGLAMKRPNDDTLFIEDFVYETGLKEEYSIAANYSRDPARKNRGFAACNWLALDRGGPARAQGLARHNLGFYVEPVSKMMPSFAARPVGFTPPEGWRPTNPSVARQGAAIVMVQRAVNFESTEDGSFRTPDDAPIQTRNFLLRLSDALEIQSSSEILPPTDVPEPANGQQRGFEDLRLFAWRGALWCCATTRELTPEGWCEQVLARIDDDDAPGPCRLVDWRVLRPPGPRLNEKNWMPQVAGDKLRFIYRCDPTRVLDEAAQIVIETLPAIAAEQFRGGTPAIEFDGGRLVLVHEVLGGGSDKQRVHHHRFVWFDEAGTLRGVSHPFLFRKKGIEFAAGLAWHPDGRRLLISFGADDSEAWIATVDAGEARSALADAAQLPSGVAADVGTAVGTPLPMGRSFDLFDTLVTRRCVHPHAIFDSVERESGRAGFAHARRAAEAEIFSGQYDLDGIYRRLVEYHGIPAYDAERLKNLELETEAANLFPILEHCRKLSPDDVVVSDMYLPAEWLEAMVRKTCGVAPRGLYVSSHGKRNGTVWPAIRQEGKLTEHVGDNPVTDLASAQAAGIPARLTTVARRSAIEDELAAAGFVPLSNLIREARLTTWHDDPALRRVQIAQVQLNFPLLFLATLHLRDLAVAQDWDHVLMSGRDCYLWHGLYQRLRLLMPGAPTAAYFLTSRVARAHPSPSYLAYFAAQRVGRRNVVVDLCGTGWSLTRLVECAPEPSVDIFLLHKLEMPDLVRDYEQYGALSSPIDVHAAIARSPKGPDNEVLERLNLAPHPGVEDVRGKPGEFRPVFSPLNYPDELTDLIRVHHAAFGHACQLLRTLASSDVAAMAHREIAPTIATIYDRMAGRLCDVMAFVDYKAHEERLVRQALEKANANTSSEEKAVK